MFYSSETVNFYKKAWKHREEVRLKALEERRQMALERASEYGKMLCEQYGAKRVMLVGSALQPERFNEQSDIDLVVFEMPKENFFFAVTACMNEDIDVDLVPFEDANEFMKKAVKESGKKVYEK